MKKKSPVITIFRNPKIPTPCPSRKTVSPPLGSGWEWGCPILLALAVLVPLHWLMVAKFAPLLMHFNIDTWHTFMRNYHMSGFDPVVYRAVADGTMTFDIVRHPLLAFMLYPLYLLNMGLTALLGVNCVQFVVGGVLLAGGVVAVLMIYRSCRAIGTSQVGATLLSLLFLSFAYVLLPLIVADHFGLTLPFLTLFIYIGIEQTKGRLAPSLRRDAWMVVLLGGITLTNAALALIICLAVRGRKVFDAAFILFSVAIPVSVLGAGAILSVLLWSDAYALMNSQLTFVGSDVSRMAILVENFLGESLQLHRDHVLGDVLTGRPVVVGYDSWLQYLPIATIVVYTIWGFIVGWRERAAQMLMGILAFNLLLHMVVGFAIEEVYIMAAHWVPVIPLAIAYLFTHPLPLPKGGVTRHHPALTKHPLFVIHYSLFTITALYLLAWHGYLLYHYLTWPLRM